MTRHGPCGEPASTSSHPSSSSAARVRSRTSSKGSGESRRSTSRQPDAGVRQACAQLELDQPVIQTVALNAASATQAIRYWRRARHRVTGICAYNDEVALAVLAGMRAHRLTAPDDLAVIGVDNIAAGALTDPALTTIATGMSALGQHLASAVINSLEGKPTAPGPGQDVIQLVRRDTG
jgi:DNA-binding LacI/PurR family transcriptional regulator